MTRHLPLVVALAMSACGGRAGEPGALAAPPRSGCAMGEGWPMRDLDGEVAAWACPGAFTGALSTRCAPGWAPCRRQPIDDLGCLALADLPASAQRGLYVGATTGWAPGPLPDPRLECVGSWAGRVGGTRVLYGCGPGGAYAGAATCGGFRTVVACGSSWTCGADLRDVANNDPQSGVICCPAP